MMKLTLKLLAIYIIFFSIFIPYERTEAASMIKVLDIKSNSVIKEAETSVEMDDEVIKAIKSIKRVTVQASPIPQEGYLIKIPLTKSVKVENKWFNDIISEVLIVSGPTMKQDRIILYNDENVPLFFDIEYKLPVLKKKLKLNE
ncbi:hypothetical protein [Virgibacillus sp. 6R]|uniref:hypothetical protein n=1 Tax=Metabacillus sp. 22489 TaxID=3453928 RepID=UPI0011AAE518